MQSLRTKTRPARFPFAVILGFSLWLMLAIPPALFAQGREPLDQTRKAFLGIVANNMKLIWNADQGEGGRGDGEIYLLTLISWGATVEIPNPQKHTHGPLGGSREVRSGVIVEDPPGSGHYRVEPELVTEGLGKLYWNEADCPVPAQIGVEAFVWEDDNNTDVNYYAGLILKGLKAATDNASSNGIVPSITDIIKTGLLSLINWLTYSEDDPVGRYSGVVTFPDPCTYSFELPVTLPLDNLTKALWEDVDAEDYSGKKFKNYGIEPPDKIGSLEIEIHGGVLGQDYSSSQTSYFFVPPPDSNRYWRIRQLDIGEPNECVLSGALSLKASLPSDSMLVTYGLYLDTDDNLSTGAPSSPARGAEYEIQLPLGRSDGVAPVLFRYDSGSSTFVPVAGAVVSSDISLDRGTVFMTADLASLGNPADSIAAWAVSKSSHGEFIAPPDAELRSPVVTVHSGPSGVPPSVMSVFPSPGARDVPSTDSLVIEFTKRMELYPTQSALSLNPPVSGTYSWNGNRLSFIPYNPLSPGVQYQATIGPSAQDCYGAGFDGNGDLISGDSYQWTFTTAPLPLFASNRLGVRKDRFVERDSVFAVGSNLAPFSSVSVYIVLYDHGVSALGAGLIDRTDDGPNLATVDAVGNLPATALGRVPQEGEYNVVVDVNQDGVYTPSIDRVDRTGIGFAVLTSAVDGKRDPTCSANSPKQDVQTSFGNSTLGLTDFANGSELDAACATVKDSTLHLFLAGNLESNFNKLEVFFDCVPGGQNRLRGNNPSVDFGGLNRMGDNGTGNGFTFDSGFLADYWIGVTGGDAGGGVYKLFANYAQLPTAGGGPGYFMGGTPGGGDGLLSDGNNPFGIRAAIDNSNTSGVGAGCGPANGDSIPTGIELAIPLAALGSPTGCIKICAFVNGSSHNFVSNQFLGPLPTGTCSLGEPRGVNLAAQAGDQFFQVCLPPPVGVESRGDLSASRIRAWPNPFRSQVSIRFASTVSRNLRAEVFDLAGRRVKSFPKRAVSSGLLLWDGRADDGRPLPAGVYLVRVRAEGFQQVARVLLLH